MIYHPDMREFKSPSKHQTPIFRARAAYHGMKRRCVGGSMCGKKGYASYEHIHLKMTMEEWVTWSLPKYEKFITENPGESPSVARNGDVGDYEISNVRIISLKENGEEKAAPLLLKENGMKLCCRCRVDLPESSFCKNRGRPDGLAHWCRACYKKQRDKGR